MKANIEYKSVLTGIKNIKKRNEVFNNLDKQSQRMEIAWDCLNLLLSKTINASDGHYWSYDLKEIAYYSEDSKEFQKSLNDKNAIKGCKVCARGAMMLSQIRLGNEIDPEIYGYDRGTLDIIKGFSHEDFLDMENTYERGSDSLPYEPNTEENLANICCNILVNGDFNKRDKTDYLV